MVRLGIEPGVAGWKVQTNPLSYGGTPRVHSSYLANLARKSLFYYNFSIHKGNAKDKW